MFKFQVMLGQNYAKFIKRSCARFARLIEKVVSKNKTEQDKEILIT